MTGWIKLWRKTLDNTELMMTDVTFKLFICLLLLVDKDSGQWSGGRYQLSEICYIKPSSTYKALKRLEKLSVVTLVSNNKYSTITICNWSEYQGNGNTKQGHQSNIKVTSECHSNKNKEYKNIYDHFDAFWSIYPRKVGKKKALEIWTKLNPNQSLVKKIISSAERQKSQWKDEQYIPHPSTWLNQARWEDEVKDEVKSDDPLDKYWRKS